MSWKCMWKIIKLYFSPRLSWRFSSKNVPVAIGGHFLPHSIHLQLKQLMVTVTVLSLPFVADYIIEVRKVRQTVLISCFLPCLRRWRSAFLSLGLWKFATLYSKGGQGVALNCPPPLKFWMTQTLPSFPKPGLQTGVRASLLSALWSRRNWNRAILST